MCIRDRYKEETYRFVDSLLDEYLSGEKPVFIGPDVHIGTDEYNAKEAEKFRYFTDRYLKYIEKYGDVYKRQGIRRVFYLATGCRQSYAPDHHP